MDTTDRNDDEDGITRHSVFEDAMALLLGTAAMALGIAMFQQAGLLAGGTAGLAFLLHYATGWSFGALFFAINLPFYWLAWRHLGRAFTLKTFVAVALLSVQSEWLPRWIGFAPLQPLYAALMGGTLIGMGMLALFRHQASVGGIGIVAVVLQQQRGWRAGQLQMALDCSIVALAFAVVAPRQVLLSVAGAVALNLVLAINHRPGRYVAR